MLLSVVVAAVVVAAVVAAAVVAVAVVVRVVAVVAVVVAAVVFLLPSSVLSHRSLTLELHPHYIRSSSFLPDEMSLSQYVIGIRRCYYRRRRNG